MKSLTNDESMRLLVCIDSTTDFEGGTEYSTDSSEYSNDYANSMNISGKSQDSMADLIGIVKPPLDLEEGIAA